MTQPRRRERRERERVRLFGESRAARDMPISMARARAHHHTLGSPCKESTSKAKGVLSTLGSGAQMSMVHHGGQQLPDIQITHSHHNRGQHAPPNSTNISPPFRAFLSQGALVWQSTRRPHQLSVQHLAPRPWPCSSRRRGDVLARLRRVVVHVPTGSVLANIGRLGERLVSCAFLSEVIPTCSLSSL